MSLTSDDDIFRASSRVRRICFQWLPTQYVSRIHPLCISRTDRGVRDSWGNCADGFFPGYLMKFRAAFRALSRGHVHLEGNSERLANCPRRVSSLRPEPVPSGFSSRGPDRAASRPGSGE